MKGQKLFDGTQLLPTKESLWCRDQNACTICIFPSWYAKTQTVCTTCAGNVCDRKILLMMHVETPWKINKRHPPVGPADLGPVSESRFSGNSEKTRFFGFTMHNSESVTRVTCIKWTSMLAGLLQSWLKPALLDVVCPRIEESARSQSKSFWR